jgi:AcrR family transcriptional regulator
MPDPDERPSLRDRKKARTRAAILAAAQRLFGEHGYDNVTVAQIADAADISVKTLFVYFRAKEELAFADTALIDAVLARLGDAADPHPDARRVGEVLAEAIWDQPIWDQPIGDQPAGLAGFHRGVGSSPALAAGLPRRWERYEDAVLAVLARRAGGEPTPALRLAANHLVAIIRSCTAPEVLVLARAAADPRAALLDWLAEAVVRTDAALAPVTKRADHP